MSAKLAAYIIVIVCLVAIFRTITLFRRDVLTVRLLLLWISIWISIGFFALFPSLLDFIRRYVNMGDRPFFITTGAIMVLFVFMFYMSSAISSGKREIVKLSREIALLHYKIEALIENSKGNDSK
jgi:hypothetical protein